MKCLLELFSSRGDKPIVILGAVALGLQIGYLPTSLLAMKRDDVGMHTACLQIHIRTFKESEVGRVNRMALEIPLRDSTDRLRSLVERLVSRCESGSAWRLPAALQRQTPHVKPLLVYTLNMFVKARIDASHVKPPLGMKLPGPSLRSGGLGLTTSSLVGLPT